MGVRQEYSLKPLLEELAWEESDYAIETDLTDEERELIADSDRRFKEHPEDFTTLEDFKAELRAMGKID